MQAPALVVREGAEGKPSRRARSESFVSHLSGFVRSGYSDWEKMVTTQRLQWWAHLGGGSWCLLTRRGMFAAADTECCGLEVGEEKMGGGTCVQMQMEHKPTLAVC